MSKLRLATEKDSTAIWGVRTEAIRGISAAYYDIKDMEKWSPSDMPSKFSEIVKNNNWYVIELLDGAIIATGFLDDKKGSVEAIFVKPAHQGKGFAAMILNKLEKLARSKKYKKLTLEATLNAENFYKKFGYKPVKKATYHSEVGLELDCVLMEKTLSK